MEKNTRIGEVAGTGVGDRPWHGKEGQREEQIGEQVAAPIRVKKFGQLSVSIQ
jgi:hypothetical protein